MSNRRLLTGLGLLSVAILLVSGNKAFGQDNTSSQSWSTTSQHSDASGTENSTRAQETHTESNGHAVDKRSVQSLGPDGRYIPYSDVETESVRVNDTTVRTTQRTYGRDADGNRTLVQQTQEESRTLADGQRKLVRTTSNPDSNGALQVVRQEVVDSKQVSPGIRDTKTTVLSPDPNGGFSATVQVEEREKQTGPGTVEFKKSTSLNDGSGHWNLSEIRQGTVKQDGAQGTKEESVLRPDSNGNFSVVERTVSKQSAQPGETRDTTETYSTNIPGQAGDDSLQLVNRASTVQRTTASGQKSTTRQIEQTNPADPGAGLHVTQEAIDIVKPGGNGTVEQKTVLATDFNGQTSVVSVDFANSNKPAAVQVDTKSASKPK